MRVLIISNERRNVSVGGPHGKAIRLAFRKVLSEPAVREPNGADSVCQMAEQSASFSQVKRP